MTLPAPGLPSLAFSTRDLPAAERFDAWRDVFSPVFDLERLDDRPARACQGAITVVDLGQLLVSRISLAGIGQRGVRTAQKARRDALDHYVVEAYIGGGCAGEAGADGFGLAAGQVGILDLGQPMTVQSARSDSVAVTIPRALLDRRVPDAARLHGTVLRDGVGGLLGDYILSLHRHLPHLSADQAAAVSQATVAMIAACLAPSERNRARAQGPAGATLLERAKRFIARNLDMPDLSVGRISAALRVSRSHLYRAFEPHGGVAAYIQTCRLANARAALLDSTDGRSISALAYDHGFASPAHFSRAFRQHFGIAPRDARASARLGRGNGPSAARPHRADIEDWLRALGPGGR